MLARTMSAESDERALDKRLTAMGLANTLALPVGATITPRTLLKSAESGELASTLVKSAELASALVEDDDDLPRISIDGRESLARMPSTRRADYAIVATLGEGGMGRVHLARERSLRRDVAVKTLKPGASNAMLRALIEEARLTGSLEHPGVIPVHAFGVDDEGRPLLVMKRVDGVDLGTLLRDRSHALWSARVGSDDPLVASLEIVMQVCMTVEFAHSRHILHRDIKPENVMVGPFGEVYLVDWGIATAEESADPAVLVGTPLYMAPEMALGDPVDGRTDVYLLGATLHEVLTGRPRHDGSTIVEVIGSATRSMPIAYGASVPAELADLLNRATARDPCARPPSAKAFREEIADFLRHRSARALSDLAHERLDALEKLLASAGDGAPKDLGHAYRLVTEARFGLTQSLREHDADVSAREEMRRCIEAAIDLELRQEHPESAEALLRELDPAPPELAGRVAALGERVAERNRGRERLERQERDLDPSQLAVWRGASVVLLALTLTVVGGYFIVFGQQPSPARILAVGLGSTCAVVGGVAVMRHRALPNAFNRRMTSLLVLACFAMVANRVLGLLSSRTASATVTIDLLLFAVVLAAVAITMVRALWASTLVPVAGIVAVQLMPHHHMGIFLAASVITLGSATWIVGRVRDRGLTALR
jgi:eukaryotic-like serine/threonine-protein kinase